VETLRKLVRPEIELLQSEVGNITSVEESGSFFTSDQWIATFFYPMGHFAMLTPHEQQVVLFIVQ